MSADPNSLDVPFARKQQLLAGLPDFAPLPVQVLQELAAALGTEVFPPGSNVVVEREIGDRMYILHSGLGEVSTIGPKGRVVLDQLVGGEMFGEIALLGKTRRRKATVTAVTQVVAVSLGAPDFHRIMTAYPAILAAFTANAEAMMNEKLQKVSPLH